MLSGPVGIVIGIITSLVGIFTYLWNTNEEFRNGVIAAWEAISAFLQPVISFIGEIIG